jgi:hypothetical protein
MVVLCHCGLSGACLPGWLSNHSGSPEDSLCGCFGAFLDGDSPHRNECFDTRENSVHFTKSYFMKIVQQHCGYYLWTETHSKANTLSVTVELTCLSLK